MMKLRTHLSWRVVHLGAGLAAILLAGCATTDTAIDSKAACTSADWEAVGLTDGKEGRNAGYIAVRRDDCAPHSVVPDLNAYEKGYVKGLVEYCTRERGYIEGESGRKYLNACPEAIAGPFLEGYAQGFAAYRDQKQFRSTQMRENALGGAETIPR